MDWYSATEEAYKRGYEFGYEAGKMDAIPVECKCCIHWKKDVPGCTDFVGRCGLSNYMIGATGFCSYGEPISNITL